MPYVDRGYWDAGYADGDARLEAGAPNREKRKRRILVKVDQEEFTVNSEDEAVALLDLARKEAEAKAEEVKDRALKALRRRPAKVMQDARKALAVPQIAGLDYAQAIMDEIGAIYSAALRDIEISLRLKRIEDDANEEEELLFLML